MPPKRGCYGRGVTYIVCVFVICVIGVVVCAWCARCPCVLGVIWCRCASV